MNAESECCGASPWMGDADYGICGECKEHCEFSDPEEELERGAASIVVSLNQGHLIITHGEDGSLLLTTPIPQGTWQGRIWKLFYDLKNENE